jgi:hypothetical protein
MEYYVGLDVSLKLTSICVVLFGANSNEGNARGGLHDARVLRVWAGHLGRLDENAADPSRPSSPEGARGSYLRREMAADEPQ